MSNDELEGLVKGTCFSDKNSRKFVYCSCWTYDKREREYLWEEYSQFKGVRIKVKKDIFGPIEVKNNLNTVYINKKIVKTHIYSYEVKRIVGPFKVKYTNSNLYHQSALHQKKINNNGYYRVFNEVDLFKSISSKTKYWKKEKEVRFLILLCIKCCGTTEAFNELIDIETPNEIYIPLCRPIEEIVIGSKNSQNEIEFIEKLAKKFNIKTKYSKFK